MHNKKESVRYEEKKMKRSITLKANYIIESIRLDRT